MTEQEQQTIEKAAKEFSKSRSDGKHFRDLECGFLAGAKALDEMRKPNFDNRAKIQELLWTFSCDATTDSKVITEEIIRLAQSCKLEQTDDIRQPEEDLVKEIMGIMKEFAPLEKIEIDNFYNVAIEIAQLLPSSRIGENDIKIPEMIVTKKF
mgnify:CR=1 FL=1